MMFLFLCSTSDWCKIDFNLWTCVSIFNVVLRQIIKNSLIDHMQINSDLFWVVYTKEFVLQICARMISYIDWVFNLRRSHYESDTMVFCLSIYVIRIILNLIEQYLLYRKTIYIGLIFQTEQNELILSLWFI